MIILRNREEMEKYYVKEVNTYVFKDNVEFLFEVEVKAHIKAHNIKIHNIKAWNINAFDIKAENINACNIIALDINADNIKAENINAYDINADNINYYAVCFASANIECNTIKGRRPNAKHFVLDGELIVRGEENDK